MIDRRTATAIVDDVIRTSPSPKRFADLAEAPREYAERHAEMLGLSELEYFARFPQPDGATGDDEVNAILDRRGGRRR